MGRHYQSTVFRAVQSECKEMADYDYDDRHNGTDEIDLSCVQKKNTENKTGGTLGWMCQNTCSYSLKLQQ
jgi:hypothetical protein